MASTDMLNGRAEFWAAALELIAQPRSLSESLGAMAGLISECFDADLCAIFLFEPRSDKLLLEACVGPGAVKGGRLRVGQGISGLAVFHNKTIQVAHMAMDPRAVFLVGEEPSDNCVVAVPFGHGEDLSGVFNLAKQTWPLFCSRGNRDARRGSW